eukprot:5059170-Prymnesium_polylepis.1
MVAGLAHPLPVALRRSLRADDDRNVRRRHPLDLSVRPGAARLHLRHDHHVPRQRGGRRLRHSSGSIRRFAGGPDGDYAGQASRTRLEL